MREVDIAVGIDVDAAGNAYVAGRIEGVDALDAAGMSTPVADVVKFSPSGEILWSRGGPIGADSEYENKDVGGVAEDGLGSVYVSGTYNSLGGECCESNPDPFLRRYDGSGNLLWTRTLNGIGEEQFARVAADKLGNVFVSGWTDGTLATPAPGFNDGFLAKYNQAGDIQWVRQYGSRGFDEFWGVAADGLGNSFVIGSYSSDEVFIRKYDTDGDEVWTVITAANPEGTEIGWDIFATESGDLLISGQADASIDTPPGMLNFQHPFVAKLDADGNWQWLTELNLEGRALGIAEDARGIIHAVGRQWVGSPDYAGFLSKFSPTGELLGTQTFESYKFTTVTSIDTFGGSVYISGFANDTSLPPDMNAAVGRFKIPEPGAFGLAFAAAAGLLMCRSGRHCR